MPLTFDITHRDAASRARAGVIQTAHGPVETPVFMPVGTRGTVKALTPGEVVDDYLKRLSERPAAQRAFARDNG